MRTPFTARCYDTVHDGLSEDRDLDVALAREEGGSVCEIGAGSGRIALPIARAGVDVTAMDLSGPMLDRLREKLTSEPPDVRERVTVTGGLSNLPGQPYVVYERLRLP